jgi:hypothetical protein
MKKLFFLAYFLLCLFTSKAQDITGTWEGSIGKQFLQINIEQSANKICGYTYNYVYRDNTISYCKAYFTASYTATQGLLRLVGTKIIDDKDEQGLFTLQLKYRLRSDGAILLEGTELPNNDDALSSSRYVAVRKIANNITIDEAMPLDCNAADFDSLQPKPALTKNTADVLPQKITPPSKPITNLLKDSVLVLPKEVALRKTEIINTIKTRAKQIVISIYDNGTVDGDTVSVFHNGKIILAHQRLSGKPVEVTIDVSLLNPKHEIILFAENLGSMPPNTALLIIQAGPKRYELRSAADLTKNASVVFEYNGE